MSKTIKRFFILALMLFTFPVFADNLLLKQDAPTNYVVKEGDTLWGIAGKFIGQPWKWPEIWHLNRQISNPHLIYPGDQIGLIEIDGKKKLTITQRGSVSRTVKLSPTARIEPIESAIPAIPITAIEGYFRNHEILNRGDFKNLPYILAGQNDRVVMGAGSKVYARGNIDAAVGTYGIYRQGQIFKDPETKEILGVQASDIGLGRVLSQEEDITTLYLEKTREQVVEGDVLLLPSAHESIGRFVPQSPNQYVAGRILSVDNGVAYIGQFNVVALNRGQRDGLEPGHVLQVKKVGQVIYDNVEKEKVRLPSEKAATMMIFRVFDKMSYALVMEATDTIRVGDFFESP